MPSRSRDLPDLAVSMRRVKEGVCDLKLAQNQSDLVSIMCVVCFVLCYVLKS